MLYAGVIPLVTAFMNWPVTPDGLVINMSRADIVFTVVICVCAILLFGINDLLGPGVLFAFVAGRYYHPRLEERALLFIDMRSSTARSSKRRRQTASVLVIAVEDARLYRLF